MTEEQKYPSEEALNLHAGKDKFERSENLSFPAGHRRYPRCRPVYRPRSRGPVVLIRTMPGRKPGLQRPRRSRPTKSRDCPTRCPGRCTRRFAKRGDAEPCHQRSNVR